LAILLLKDVSCIENLQTAYCEIYRDIRLPWERIICDCGVVVKKV